MLRSVLFLKLPETVTWKLQSMGYEYIEDIERALRNLDKVPPTVKTIILEHNVSERVLEQNKPIEPTTGTALWQSEEANPPMTVFHEGLDKLLGGGLPLGRIVEVCGSPGCGKTQLCLQFCVDVQMPEILGGSAAEALYISTDFGFSIDRLKEIVRGTLDHFSKLRHSTTESFNMENFLRSVRVLRSRDVNHLKDCFKSLKGFLEIHPRIKLVVVDSFSLPFVVEIDDLVTRSKTIAESLDLLLESAVTFKISVVLTNQLTTVVAGNKSELRPSLGEGFGHRTHVRLLLDDGKIYLTKSVDRPQLYTTFSITKDGIR